MLFFFFLIKNFPEGRAWWLSTKESACQCRRHGFNSWSGKIPHAPEQLGSCATTTEPVLWSLGTTATEACAPQREATATRSPQRERSPACHTQRKARAAMKTQHKSKKYMLLLNPKNKKECDTKAKAIATCKQRGTDLNLN